MKEHYQSCFSRHDAHKYASFEGCKSHFTARRHTTMDLHSRERKIICLVPLI